MSFRFVIKGNVATKRYIFIKHIVLDNTDLSATEVLKLSKSKSYGYKGEIFGFVLSFIGWRILGIILAIPTLGLAAYCFATYMVVAITE